MPALAHVVPLTPVDGVYTYRVPEAMADEALPDLDAVDRRG